MKFTESVNCRPCPTCGSAPDFFEWEENNMPPFMLICADHKLSGGKTKKELIDNWNDQSLDPFGIPKHGEGYSMTNRVSELTGPMLDYWVGKTERKTLFFIDGVCYLGVYHGEQGDVGIVPYSPSTDWSQGGPIIKDCNMDLRCYSEGKPTVRIEACMWAKGSFIGQFGDTHLEAAMRCFVASKYGELVDDSQTHND